MNSNPNPETTNSCRPYSVSLEDSPEIDPTTSMEEAKEKLDAYEMLSARRTELQKDMIKLAYQNVKAVFNAIYNYIENCAPGSEPLIMVSNTTVLIDCDEKVWLESTPVWGEVTNIEYELAYAEHFVYELDKRLLSEGFKRLERDKRIACRLYKLIIE